MEHIQQLLRHLKSFRNRSAHKAELNIFLSSQFVLIFIVFEWLSASENLSSPLAVQFLESVLTSKIFQYGEFEKIRDYLPFDIEELSNEEFIALSQGLFQECLKDLGRVRNEVYTPTKLNEILVDLINPKTNQIIYDPACGIGSTFVEIHKKYSNLNLKYIGQEINQSTSLLCQINLLVNGIENAEIYSSDSTVQLVPKHVGEVDIAISQPPFIPRFVGNFIETMISMTDDTGKIIVVVPENFLFSSIEKPLREKYLSNDWVEEIISLPEDIYKPYISVKTSILILNKYKKNKNVIKFGGIDFKDSSKFENVLIDSKAISQSDLRANRYALKSQKEIEAELSNSIYSIKISDIVLINRTGRNQFPTDLDNYKSPELLPFIRVSDLSKKDGDYNLDLSRIERKTPIVSPHNMVNFSAVLCSLIGTNLKPTYFDYSGQPIIIGSDVIALQLAENVNIEYFLNQLNSKLVQTQIEARSSGSTINRIRKEDFLNIKIILPPLEEQTRQAIEFLKEKQKELQQDISEEKKEVKLTEYDIIHIIVHDLNHKLGAMQDDLDSLKQYFEKTLPNYLQEPIKPVFDDESEDEINQIRLINVLKRLINTRNQAHKQLSRTREVLQNNTVLPVYKNFKKWLEKDVKSLHENQIDFVIEGESIELEFDTNRFRDLINDLIINAKQHNARRVVFELSYLYLGDKKQNSGNARILYKNDGEPFPKDFNFDIHFRRLYGKSSKSKGSGIGGYSINKTIELHSGMINNVSPEKDTFDLFPVQIEIILPIKHIPNPNYVKTNPYTTN